MGTIGKSAPLVGLRPTPIAAGRAGARAVGLQCSLGSHFSGHIDIILWATTRDGCGKVGLRQGGGPVLIEHILYGKGRDVATIGPDASVAEAVALLQEHNVGALVVVEAEARIVGILSERDIVRALAEESIGHTSILERQVSDLMTREVATCGSRSSVNDLMRMMTDRRIRHVPVVDDDGLNGIVSIGDVVKSRIGELETEAGTLHDYLSSGRT
jgi:CBS domain-containing protein